jgi:hypothetical protein
MNIERVSAFLRQPASGESVVFYSENTGVHRGFYDCGVWRDIFNQHVERVTAWWPTSYCNQLSEAHG